MCASIRPGGTIAFYVWDYPGGDAKLIGANLSEANLTGANLLGASLEKVVARGTILEGAKLDPGANLVTTERRAQRRAR